MTSLLASARWLALSGSLLPGTPSDGYGRLIDRARAAGVPAAVDSRGAWLTAAIETGRALVKINAHEAHELLGAPVEHVRAGSAAARAIRERTGGTATPWRSRSARPERC